MSKWLFQDSGGNPAFYRGYRELARVFYQENIAGLPGKIKRVSTISSLLNFRTFNFFS